jgi:hypothetical protein
MMPVKLHDKDVARLDAPLAIVPVGRSELAREGGRGMRSACPSVYWLHEVEPLPGATVHLGAGAHPLLVTRAVGRGRVAVFAGTVLGEKRGTETPFWEWDGWKSVLESTVRWAAGQ